MAAPTGRIIVGTSTGPADSLLATLVIIEAALGPIALLSLFVAATVVGRRAATPIERMRVGQLDFTADASHELRTPLSVIEAEVGLALSSNRSAEAYREALERISHESGRLRDIVDDLLWLARVDSLPDEPLREPVDVAEIVRSCAQRFQPVAAQRGIELSINADFEASVVVLAPADWLDRLVSVLLDNACRYSRDGGRIEVSVETGDEQVRLFVDDDGPGFKPEERLALLERFHRASDVPGGAGLGLAIANAVVRATDGKLELGRSSSGGARVAASWARFLSDDDASPPQRHHRRSKVRPH
jgi:signal transduction histidine kinase